MNGFMVPLQLIVPARLTGISIPYDVVFLVWFSDCYLSDDRMLLEVSAKGFRCAKDNSSISEHTNSSTQSLRPSRS